MSNRKNIARQRAGETPEEYSYFCAYRSQPPGSRSIRETVRRLGLDEHTGYSIAARWDWRQRAAAWDSYLADAVADEQERRTKANARKLAKAWDGLADLALAEVERRLTDPEHRLSTKDLVDIVREATKVHRLEQNEATEIHKVEPVPIATLTVEEQEQMRALILKMESGGDE